MPFFVLVPSPFVGAETWATVATALQDRGERAVIAHLPSLHSGPEPAWRAMVDAVRLETSEVVEVPPWAEARGTYLQLSPLFAPDADAAAARGWPVERIDAAHLHLVVDPVDVAARIAALAARVPAAR